MKTVESGKRGEALAEIALNKAGMKTLARNYRFGHLELDLVMLERKSGTIVFVEVKARKSEKALYPREAIGSKKRMNLRRAAEGYCMQNQIVDTPCRFDVVEVWLDTKRVEHIENAF